MTCHRNYNIGSKVSLLVSVAVATAAAHVGCVAAVGAMQLPQRVPKLARSILLLETGFLFPCVDKLVQLLSCSYCMIAGKPFWWCFLRLAPSTTLENFKLVATGGRQVI